MINILLIVGIILFVIILIVLVTIVILSFKDEPKCEPNCSNKKCGESDGCKGKCQGFCPSDRICVSGECITLNYVICSNGVCIHPKKSWVKDPNRINAQELIDSISGVSVPSMFYTYIDTLLKLNPFGGDIPYVDFYKGNGYMALNQQQLAYIAINTLAENYLVGVEESKYYSFFKKNPNLKGFILFYLLRLSEELGYVANAKGNVIYIVRPTVSSPSENIPISPMSIQIPKSQLDSWPIENELGAVNIYEQGTGDYFNWTNISDTVVFITPEVLISFFWTTEINPLNNITFVYGSRRYFNVTSGDLSEEYCFRPRIPGPILFPFTININGEEVYNTGLAFIETSMIEKSDETMNNYDPKQRTINVNNNVNRIFSIFNEKNWPERCLSLLYSMKSIKSGPWGATNNNNDSQLFYMILNLALSYIKDVKLIYVFNKNLCPNKGNVCFTLNNFDCNSCLRGSLIPNSNYCGYDSVSSYLSDKKTMDLLQKLNNIPPCGNVCQITLLDSLM